MGREVKGGGGDRVDGTAGMRGAEEKGAVVTSRYHLDSQ